MAREYARIMLSIWSDEDFLALDSGTQRAFLLLISQPELTTCGVQSYAPRRWAKKATDTTPRKIEHQIERLERPRLIILDRDTDELLIRSYVRYDKALRTANVAKSLVTTFNQVQSDALQKVIVAELCRLFDECGDNGWTGWNVPGIQLLLGLGSR